MSAGNILGTQSLGNITSADVVVYATCEQVAPTAVRVTEFADGGGVNQDSREHAVTKMGIDGKFVYGIVFRPGQVTLTLFPTSPFLTTVDQCLAISKRRRRGLKWTLEVTYPAIGKHYSFSEGICTNSPDMPPAEDTLGNVAVQFQFGEVDVHNIGIGDY